MSQTIAHEGSHVEDDLAFLNSYDSKTGTYNEGLNITHFDTEFKAFEIGSEVQTYSMFQRGPSGYQQLENYLNTAPAYRNIGHILVFPTGQYPQGFVP